MNAELDYAYRLAEATLCREVPVRWAHSVSVMKRAMQAGPMFDAAELDLLCSASILHDIGYASAARVTGFHALDGARFLEKNSTPVRVCALVAHHSCAYMEAELRGQSAQLAKWVDEKTALRDALWWADMTTTPNGGVTNVRGRIAEIQERYGPEHLVTFFIRQAMPELVAAVERTEERLRAVGVDYTAK
ncbi:HD domain-containing protein [Lentzea albidocapillata]|uniref:HD domain-containing protein n=1 Tax=Lentzea albidocapillata TaxID=40571 RepID=UPI001FEB7C07|nr:HD domain-containing protein [Lentzea albidocapillata]